MSNFPQSKLDAIPAETVGDIVMSLRGLHELGKPANDDAVEMRIDQYFQICQNTKIRPGIESLCLALHISRQTLFNWSNGNGCSDRCMELIQSAKAFVAAYVEQAMLGGRISPPSGIFLMKNWLNYKDAISLEESIPQTNDRKVLTIDQLPKLGFGEMEE